MGNIRITNQTAPSSPSTGQTSIYSDSGNKRLKFIDDSGESWSVKNFVTKAVDPTVNEDSGDGYSVGDSWLNSTNGKMFLLKDSTVGAAVWIDLTTSGGVTDHGALTGLGDDDHTQYLNETRHDALAADNPHSVTFTQAVTADGTTDITGAECETLTDGSNADALHTHAGGASLDFAEYSGVTVTEPPNDGVDEIVTIDTTNKSSANIFLSSDILTFNSGTYLVLMKGNFVSQSDNAHRQCILDAETGVGSFTKVTRSRAIANVRNSRNQSVFSQFIFVAASSDRLRLVVNIDAQADKTEFSECTIVVQKIG